MDSTIPVTRTKILLPRRPASILARPRLMNLLDGFLDSRLVLLTAPAGYGKTSLLLDLAHQVEMPVCWYALDTLDHDPQRFIIHLIASIAGRFPDFGVSSAAAVQSMTSTDVDMDRLVSTIVNEAYEQIREHFVVVLDDFHLVDDSELVNRFVSQFIQKMDENCHLILSSRTLLALPDLPLMVARSQVGGLDFEELAFRPDEIQALALQNHHVVIPDSQAEELVQETEGWITGLLLSTQTIWHGMADRVRVARASGVGLYEYLAQQVLDQQPAEIRDFLLRTSLLEEFDTALCEQVLGSEVQWQRRIERVLRSNLFVLPVDNGGTWLRYHHLFRDFLQARMARDHPDEQERILCRLTDVYADQGEWEKAHSACRRLGDLAATADLIERASTPMVKSGRLILLAKWIDLLPPELLDARPGLLSARGDAAVMLGEVARGLILLNQATTALRATDDQPLLARTLVRRAGAHRFLGQYQASLDDANEASALAEQREYMQAILAGAWQARGIVLYYMGQLDAAIEWLQRSLAARTALGNRQSAALLLNDLGLAYMSAGRIALALDHYQRALDFWQQNGNLFRQATILNNLGVLYHLRGEYEQALTFLDRAHQTAQQSSYPRMGAIALAGIGDLFADLAAPGSARDAYGQARQIALKLEDRNQLRYLALAEVALVRVEGDTPQAQRLLITAGNLMEEGSSSYERGLWQLEAGRLALTTDDLPGARTHLVGAIHHFERGGQPVEASRAHLHLATACHRSGDQQGSQEHLARAFELAAGLESQHLLVISGRSTLSLLLEVQHDTHLGPPASMLLRRVTQFEREIPVLRRRLRWRNSVLPAPPPRLTIQAFGRVRVRHDGKPIIAPEWQSRRIVRDLFFLVLAHPQGLTKETIGAILWPNSSPAQLKLRFKNAIYRLRRALGQDVVLFENDLYLFNREIDYEYDAEVFLTWSKQARAAADTAGQVNAYRRAAGLYRGPYLPEAGGSWVWQKREELRRIFQEAANYLADYYLQIADYDQALDFCHRVLADDAFHEEAHRVAMRVHAAVGDRAAVIRQFEDCRRHLSEINASPSPQTWALCQSLTR